VAETFLARGWRVVSIDRTAKEEGGEPVADHLCLTLDLLDERAVERGIAEVIERFGRIDALCNVAGGFRMGSAVHALPDTDLAGMVNINVMTMLHATRGVVPHMIRRRAGYVVNVAAYAGTRGTAAMGAYSATKAMVVRLTESMAEELAEHGINVNCVLPTIIDTPENRSAMPGSRTADWVPPAALADAIAFLCTRQARAIRGAAIPVCGGVRGAEAAA